MYPMVIDGEQLFNASEYVAFLIRKGYAEPDAPIEPVAPDAYVAPEKGTCKFEDRFDFIESETKKTFGRGRKKNGVQ